MNSLISLLVHIFAWVLVISFAFYLVTHYLGDWSALVWIVLGFFLLMGVMARVNS